MKIKITTTTEKRYYGLEMSEINIVSIKDDSKPGKNPYTNGYERLEGTDLFKEFYESDSEGTHLCPHCGKFNESDKCICNCNDQIATTEDVAEDLEANKDISNVSIYINGVCVKQGIPE